MRQQREQEETDVRDGEHGSLPRRLPIVRVDGDYYFVDVRLRQLRSIERPIRFIDFEPEIGPWIVAFGNDRTDDV